MASYNYADTPNSNLVCCICRNPFVDPVTTRTCSHSFCNTCIIRALSHSPQCPVDRSPLTLDDLLPASPIVRSLVDELIVECSNNTSGCTYTCQRQLLTVHIEHSCSYAEVPCPVGDCEQTILRKDVETHRCAYETTECEDCGIEIKATEYKNHAAECSSQTYTCEFCSEELPRSLSSVHNTTCPDFVISCDHVSHGCSWEGPRASVPSHISSCAYEKIKGFFVVNRNRMTSLEEENLVLRHKVDTLEGLLQRSTNELQVAKSVLGPWYRAPDPHMRFHGVSSELPSDVQPASASTSQPYFHAPEYLSSPSPYDTSSPSNTGRPDILASYFPSETAAFSPYSRPTVDHSSPPAAQGWRPSHRPSPSMPQNWDASTSYGSNPGARPIAQTSIAPINLSTTLEGTLGGLRESLVTVAASVESLGRRNDIALTNEALRLNEEVMSLKANVHGLRMQVHAIMMDRNAQITGRGNESVQGDGPWPAIQRLNYAQGLPPSAPSITKL